MAQLIRERLLPGDFSDASTSIEEQGGKLVVMQRPEVHGKIRRILQSFRETQSVQVLTQVRFIDTVDGFLEQIGVNITGLDGQPIGANAGGVTRPNITTPWGYPNSHSLYPMGGGANGTAYDQAALWSNHGTNLVHPRIDPSFPNNGVLNGMAAGIRKQFGSAQLLQGITQNLVYLFQNGPFASTLSDGSVSREGMMLQFRFLHSIQANLVLQAIRKSQTNDVLLASKLMQFNNQRAHLLVATQQSYIYDYDVSGDVWDPIIRAMTTGVVLEIKPTVSHDRKYITLDLRPGVAELIRFRQLGTMAGNDTSGTDGQPPVDPDTGLPVNDGSYVAANALVFLPIDLPQVELRFVNTTVTVPDSGTLLFSGMINDHKLDGKTGVPFFSDLPVIGRIFGTNAKQRERRNLMIMVNSKVVLFDEEEDKL